MIDPAKVSAEELDYVNDLGNELDDIVRGLVERDGYAGKPEGAILSIMALAAVVAARIYETNADQKGRLAQAAKVGELVTFFITD